MVVSPARKSLCARLRARGGRFRAVGARTGHPGQTRIASICLLYTAVTYDPALSCMYPVAGPAGVLFASFNDLTLWLLVLQVQLYRGRGRYK